MSTYVNHPHASHPCPACDQDQLVFGGWTDHRPDEESEAVFICEACGHQHVCAGVTRGD